MRFDVRRLRNALSDEIVADLLIHLLPLDVLIGAVLRTVHSLQRPLSGIRDGRQAQFQVRHECASARR